MCLLKIIRMLLSSSARRMHVMLSYPPIASAFEMGYGGEGSHTGAEEEAEHKMASSALLLFSCLFLPLAGAVSASLLPSSFPLEKKLFRSFQLLKKAEWTELCIASWRWLFNLRWVWHYSLLWPPLIRHHLLLLSSRSTHISAPNASPSCCLLDAVRDYLLEKADGYLV